MTKVANHKRAHEQLKDLLEAKAKFSKPKHVDVLPNAEATEADKHEQVVQDIMQAKLKAEDRIRRAEEVDNNLRANRYLQLLSEIDEEGLPKPILEAEKDHIQYLNDFNQLSPEKRHEIQMIMEFESAR